MQLNTLDRIYPARVEAAKQNHLARYKWALGQLSEHSGIRSVLDGACGAGYGSQLLCDAGYNVLGVDASREALGWAVQQFHGPIFLMADLHTLCPGGIDAVVSIETLEHMKAPRFYLMQVRSAKVLISSVPNEKVVPFAAENFAGQEYPHVRHYTPDEFEELLESAGWKVTGKFSQRSKIDTAVYPDTLGYTLMYVCE